MVLVRPEPQVTVQDVKPRIRPEASLAARAVQTLQHAEIPVLVIQDVSSETRCTFELMVAYCDQLTGTLVEVFNEEPEIFAAFGNRHPGNFVDFPSEGLRVKITGLPEDVIRIGESILGDGDRLSIGDILVPSLTTTESRLLLKLSVAAPPIYATQSPELSRDRGI